MKYTYDKNDIHLELFLGQISDQISAVITSIVVKDGKADIYTSVDLSTEQENDLASKVLAHNPNDFSRYMILDLVNEDFAGFPLENVDFARHLKASIALDKEPVKGPDGRPVTSDYYYDFGGDIGRKLVAQIAFDFSVTPDNLVYRKKELLVYYRYNGTTDHEEILKSDLQINFNNLAHGDWVIQERIGARQSIVKEMNYFLLGVMKQATGLSTDDILPIVKPYFDDHKKEKDNFEEYGMIDWKNKLENLDITKYTVPLGGNDIPWMAFPINAQGVTIQQYMISRLSY